MEGCAPRLRFEDQSNIYTRWLYFAQRTRGAHPSINLKNQVTMNLIISLILVGGLWLALFPNFVNPIGTGIDASAQYAVNLAAAENWSFGDNLAFTFGPLGYLLIPENTGHNLVYGIIFQVTIYTLFCAALLYWVRQEKIEPLPLLTFVIAWTVVFKVFALCFDNFLLLALLFVSYLAVIEDRRLRRYLFVLAVATLAGILPYTKFNLGLAGGATIFLLAGILWWKRGFWSAASALIIYFWVTTSIAVLFIGDLVTTFHWLRFSLSLADGYSTAMSLVGPIDEVLLALAFGIFVLTSAFWSARRREPLAIFYILSLGCLFVIFKHGFVRHDPPHLLSFVSFALGLNTLTLILAGGSKCWKRILNWHVIILSICVCLLGANRTGSSKDCLLGREGYDNLCSVFHFAELSNYNDLLTKRALRENRLPPRLIHQWHREGLKIDVLPWELSIFAANRGLKWQPSPFLQLYTIYTPILDKITAKHFSGTNKPDLLLVSELAIDKRHLFFDTPLTWRAIMDGYEYSDYLPENNGHLLKKRPQPLQKNDEAVTMIFWRSEDWLAVPGSTNLITAHWPIRLTTCGRIMKTLFHIPPAYLHAEYEDGITITYRFLPEQAGNGLVANYLPREKVEGEFAKALQGQPFPRVKRISFSGPGLFYYDTTVPIVWREWE